MNKILMIKNQTKTVDFEKAYELSFSTNFNPMFALELYKSTAM